MHPNSASSSRTFAALAGCTLILIGCAPTPVEIQGAKVWAHVGETLVPPIPAPPLKAKVETDSVGGTPGPVKIWHCQDLPDNSQIIGTLAQSSGGVVVYSMSGEAKQRFGGIGYPAGIDVEYAMRFGENKFMDVAVVLDQSARMLHIYSIDPATGELANVTGRTDVLYSTEGDASIPTGLALFRHPSGTVYACVSRKLDDGDGVVWEYELQLKGGRVNTKKVRTFAIGSKNKPVLAMTVDDGTGYLYLYDEENGIQQYYADPNRKDLKRPLTKFGFSGWEGRPSGLGVFVSDEPGGGYLVGLDSAPGVSSLLRYKREDIGGDPLRHAADPISITLEADSPKGFDVTSSGIGKRFGEGFFVVANNKDENYRVFPWQDIAINRANHNRELLREKREDLTRASQ